jgi:hypothetical protein
MELSAFPDLKTRGNGQIGKKGCRQKKGMSGKLADIDVLARHVADILPTFPTKLGLDGGAPPFQPHVDQSNLDELRGKSHAPLSWTPSNSVGSFAGPYIVFVVTHVIHILHIL